ncbi:MAG: hypothetical protein HUN04_19930 [Desulfobacter sp.]|nr:MAG: hypothetical protein HUN04_19930 [Desulfobacter sp.]
MIHYTTMESQDYGLLMFKVIGADSREAAQNATIRSWDLNESLKEGSTIEGSITICPLFGDLKQSRDLT